MGANPAFARGGTGRRALPGVCEGGGRPGSILGSGLRTAVQLEMGTGFGQLAALAAVGTVACSFDGAVARAVSWEAAPHRGRPRTVAIALDWASHAGGSRSFVFPIQSCRDRRRGLRPLGSSALRARLPGDVVKLSGPPGSTRVVRPDHRPWAPDQGIDGDTRRAGGPMVGPTSGVRGPGAGVSEWTTVA